VGEGEAGKVELCPQVEAFLVELMVGGAALSSYSLATRTVELVRCVVEEVEWATAEQLLRCLRAAARRVETALPEPKHFVVHNIFKRILKLIREEYLSASKSAEHEQLSSETRLQRMLKSSESTVSDYGKDVSDLRERVAEILEELTMELEMSVEEISRQAIEHIHANEVILTIGRSRTVERFLKYAAKTRKFQVMIAEGGPSLPGHAMAASLSAAKVSSTVITDSAIFAMMARVNKVIIGTQAIMADGSLIAIAGTQTLCLAAAHYSVPVLVLGATYKISPKFLSPCEVLGASVPLSPAPVLQSLVTEKLVRGFNPSYSMVKANLVTSFISNVSGYSPSFVLRQVNDLYHARDRDLSTETV